jgi:hypothetical protein
MRARFVTYDDSADSFGGLIQTAGLYKLNPVVDR